MSISFCRRGLLGAVWGLLICAAAAPAGEQAAVSPEAALRVFRIEHGPGWRAHADRDTGVPRFIWGGNIPLGIDTREEGLLVDAARAMVDRLAGVTGVSAATLTLEAVKRLRLSRIGSSDKVAVLFQQGVGGVPVHRGTVSVLFSEQGDFLALDTNGLPRAEVSDTLPQRSIDRAVHIASEHFAKTLDLPVAAAEPFGRPLVLYPLQDGRDPGRAELAWLVRIDGEVAETQIPVARAYAVAARGAARVLGDWSLVHEGVQGAGVGGRQRLGGTSRAGTDTPAEVVPGIVRGWGQPGLLPDGIDGVERFPLPDVRVKDFATLEVFSDATGRFFFPLVVPATLTAELDGQYSRVSDYWEPAPVIPWQSQDAVPGSLAVFEFNRPSNERLTAVVNVHRSVLAFRDWVRAVDPTETAFDFPVVSSVNGFLTCGAVYNGSSIRFGRSGVPYGYQCPNMAFSTVVWHEEGHWANDLFGSGNGADGFGEGAADAWSTYIADDAIVGRQGMFGFQHGRTGWNTRSFCGEENPGCHGAVHADGEVLLGALWKVRARLRTVLGHAAGADVADRLFLSWFQAFDDGEIATVVMDHWLALDDDDGDASNGTPHEAEIRCGFTAQGFPVGLLEAGQITGSNAGDETFGSSVALQGDLLVVGARDGSDDDESAAYVFERSGSQWLEQARLLPGDLQVYDDFGASVALDGDTIAVGAPLMRSGGLYPYGAAYVFVFDGSVWSQQAKLTSAEAAVRHLGSDIALDADTLAVGASAESLNSGAVYVYRRTGTRWTQEARLVGSGVDEGDDFGTHVDLAGDRIAVSAVHDSTVEYRAGSAYVFARSGTTWSEEALLLPEARTDAQFGFSLDLSDPGGDELAVGTFNGGADGAGSFYLFSRTGTAWSRDVLMPCPDAGHAQHFGTSIALDGDRIAVGAYTGATNGRGAVYLFRGAGSSWFLQDGSWIDDPLSPSSAFGACVDMEGETLVVGAPTSGTGRAYVFEPGNPFALYGAGLAGHDMLAPVLWACGDPASGKTVVYHVYGGVPGGSGELTIGSGRAAVFDPALGGTVLVDNIAQQIPLTLDDGGAASYEITYPISPDLTGDLVNLQWWGDDSSGPSGHAASNGLEYTILSSLASYP